MTARPRPCSPADGIAGRAPSPEARERGKRNTRRAWSDKHLAAKLDDLLAYLDEDDAPAEVEP